MRQILSIATRTLPGASSPVFRGGVQATALVVREEDGAAANVEASSVPLVTAAQAEPEPAPRTLRAAPAPAPAPEAPAPAAAPVMEEPTAFCGTARLRC
jgi:hypothetical protein